jgi:arabinan endo-1,5-alpha-L-arabinosidase
VRTHHRARRWAAGVALAVVGGLALSPSALAAPSSVDTGRHDPSPAPSVLPTGGLSVTGETSPVHDPALIVADDGTWYVFSTGLVNRENGGTIQIWSSDDDGVTWSSDGTVWDEIPAWIDEHFADGALPDNLWAPEVYEHDGTYYLYYSASRFGTNTSVTALATNTTLDPSDPDYEWVDQGPVITSPQEIENGKTFNAIDAGIVEGADGTPYMAIGSYWYGIFLVELEWPSGKLADGALADATHIVDRFVPGNPVEAPYIVERDGYYYAFVSFDACCRGLDSTYKIAVGRADSVTGPYLDQDGRDLFGGGGTVLLESHGAMVGPGGQSVFDDVLAFHYYDASNAEIPGFPTLGLHRLDWTQDGWPVVDTTAEAPTVVTPPQDASVRQAGPTVRFEVEVAGAPAPVVTWERSTDGGRTWRPAGAAERAHDGTATLSLHRSQASPGVQVRAQVSNAHGSVTSEPAKVTLPRPARAGS